MANSKMILIFFACSTVAFHPACRAPVAHSHIHVLDYEHDLDSLQIMKLDSLYADHQEFTTNEIALVTTATYSPDSNILFYSVDKLRELGLGRQDVNNGLIIVFSKAHHEVRIGTGYGTEKVLKDGIAKRIIDSLMLPVFRKDSIFEGLWLGSKAIVDFLEIRKNQIK